METVSERAYMSWSLEIPKLRTWSANSAHAGIHRFVRIKRAKEQREAVMWEWKARRGWEPVEFPLAVTITRISPGKLDDDNLSGGLKSVRDGVTDCLIRLTERDVQPIKDDRDPRIVWDYDQVSHGRGEYAVQIRLEGLDLTADLQELGERKQRLTLKLREQVRRANR